MFILFLNLYYFKSFCYEIYMTDNKNDFIFLYIKSDGTLQKCQTNRPILARFLK